VQLNAELPASRADREYASQFWGITKKIGRVHSDFDALLFPKWFARHPLSSGGARPDGSCATQTPGLGGCLVIPSQIVMANGI
jgi:hypothetical protein